MSKMLVIKLYLFEIKSHLIPPPPPPFHRAGASLISSEIISILSPSISRVMYESLLRKGAEDQSPRLHSGSDFQELWNSELCWGKGKILLKA